MPRPATSLIARALVAVLVASAVLPLAACAAAPEQQPYEMKVDPESALGLPALIGLEPIVRPETRVLEAEDLAALSPVELVNPECLAWDGAPEDRPLCHFLLRFAALPDGVVVGSVLVADVSAATPHGLLVVVDEIDGTVVSATEGTLGDALEQGEFVMERQFTAADVTHVELAPGVTEVPARGPAALGGGGSPASPSLGVSAPQIGAGLAFNYKIDKEIVAGVHATGSVGFNIGCGAYGGLTWKKWHGIPLYPNGAYFEGKCGAGQEGAVTFTGSQGVAIDESYDLAVVDLAAITFFVGPVPIVLVPTITVSVDAKGNIGASMSVGASEKFSATVGIKYSHGFSVIKEFDSGFDKQVTTGSARLSLTGGVSLGEALLLYGIAGPKLIESLYLNLEGKPVGEKPIWCLKGGLKASASIGLDLGITYLGWGPEELFDSDTELGCAANTPPKVKINTPAQGAVFYPGTSGVGAPKFSGSGFDEEDGNLTVTWMSDKDGELGTTKSSTGLAVPNLSLGTHVITATATDGDGAVGTATVTVTAKDGSPSLGFLGKDTEGTWYPITTLSGYQGSTAYIRLSPVSPVPLSYPNCDKVTFSGMAVTRISNCDYSVALSSQGSFTLTAKLTDADGKSGTGSIKAVVSAPPAVIVPQFSTVTGTVDGQAISDGASASNSAGSAFLTIAYTNAAAAGVPVTYSWSIRKTYSGSAPGAWVAQGSVEGPVTASSSRFIGLGNTTTSSLLYELKVTVTKAGGAVLATRTFAFSQLGQIR